MSEYIEYVGLVLDYLEKPNPGTYQILTNYVKEHSLPKSSDHKILPDTLEARLARLAKGNITEWANLIRPAGGFHPDFSRRLHSIRLEKMQIKRK